MGRFGFFGGFVALFWAWWERLIAFEWLWFALRFLLEGGWWVIKGLFQLGVAAVVLFVGQHHLDLRLTPDTALEALAKDFLKTAPWREGDSSFVLWTTERGDKYWVMMRGVKDTENFVDKKGNKTTQRCIHVFAAEAQAEKDAFVRPSPYLLGIMKWSDIATECKFG